MGDPKQPGDEKQRPTTISLGDEEGVKKVLSDTVFGLWSIVNNLTRLRPAKRERYRVTIFGSARTKPGTGSTKRSSGCPRRLRKWAATSSPAAAQD